MTPTTTFVIIGMMIIMIGISIANKIPDFASKKGPCYKPLLNWTGSVFHSRRTIWVINTIGDKNIT